MRVIFCLPNTTQNYIISHLDYNIIEILYRRLSYNLLHTNNSNVQSLVYSKLLLYPNLNQVILIVSLIHVLNKINVPPLSAYELSVCNNVRELCQLRDNLYWYWYWHRYDWYYCNAKWGMHWMTLALHLSLLIVLLYGNVC